MWRANALSVMVQRLMDFATRESTADCHPKSAAISGTAPNTQNKPCRDVTQLLERRAAKVTNKSLRRVYLEKCEILSRGA